MSFVLDNQRRERIKKYLHTIGKRRVHRAVVSFPECCAQIILKAWRIQMAGWAYTSCEPEHSQQLSDRAGVVAQQSHFINRPEHDGGSALVNRVVREEKWQMLHTIDRAARALWIKANDAQASRRRTLAHKAS